MERTVHERGLVTVLRELHDAIDRAALDAYGWPDLIPLLDGGEFDALLLERLVALNVERTAEERQGHIRWLRPTFQAPVGQSPALQTELDATSAAEIREPVAPRPWPKTLAEQARAVAETLAEAGEPLTAAALAARFQGAKIKPFTALLETLVALGRARAVEGGRFA